MPAFRATLAALGRVPEQRVWAERNLLKICLQNRNCSLQVVNTKSGHIHLHASTREQEVRALLESSNQGNTSDSGAARAVAVRLAQRAQEVDAVQMTWERGQQPYTGKTKVIVDTLRDQGIQFVSSVESKAAQGGRAAAGAADADGGAEDVEEVQQRKADVAEMQRRKARGQTYPVPPGVRRNWWVPGVVNGGKSTR